jgi:hypothetical protein
MTAFTILWFGQAVSIIGSAMSAFALTIWAWKITGQATALALVWVFNLIPSVVVSPLAGVLVDRWNKKLVMALSDLASVLTSAVILWLAFSERLAIWHLYALGAFNGLFQAFQFPASTAGIAAMIPKEQYARSSSMMSIVGMGSGILAPLSVGVLLGIIGLPGILLIDFLTFLIAILALVVVEVPEAPSGVGGKATQGSVWQEALSGFRYVRERPGLMGLLWIFCLGNFFAAATFTAPMLLARTQNNTQILGLVSSIASAGGVIGSLVLIAWGGPKRKILGVIFGWLAGGLLGVCLMGVNGGLPVWLAAGFCGGFLPMIIDASNQAIWMAKVPLAYQGRISSVRWVFAVGTPPLAMMIAGPLADRVFEPAMRSGNGFLPAAFGWIAGTGPGAGMAVMFLVAGLCIILVSLIAYAVPSIRNIESLLPDHTTGSPAVPQGILAGAAPGIQPVDLVR